MNIFLFEDYKLLLKARIKLLPRRGHGQIEKMARAIGVHQSFVSQIFHTTKHFSEEQAYLICQHLHFSDIETEYFIALVQRDRATTEGLKNILNKHIQRLRKQPDPTENLDRNITSLAEEDKQVFYSHWHFMAVWLLTAIPKFDSVEKISRHLNLPVTRIKEIIEFLLHVGLCMDDKGKLSINVKRTLVTRGSPMLSRHHTNWRLRSIDILQMAPTNTIFYTHPMTVSEKDANLIREILIKTISAVEPLVEPSPSEKTFCLNIDWFEF